MRPVRRMRSIPAIGLGLGLALAIPAAAPAQGPPISSGSGSGTGTGMSSSSFGATGTGSESTTGLGTTGTGRSSLPGAIGSQGGAGTGGLLTRPIDRNPLANENGLPPSGGLSVVEPHLFLDARSVTDPGERALALVRIAQTAIFSKQMEDAHTALFEAVPAALAERHPLVRQQRMVAVVDALLSLAEERMAATGDVLAAPVSPAPDVNRGSNNLGSALDAGRTPAAALPDDARNRRLQAALPEWAMAVDVATRLEEVNTRTEALFRIVESEAYSSQRLITDPIRPYSGGRPDPNMLPADLRSYADGLMVNAARHAAAIERPIWRNSAFYSIVSNAAASSQFARGFEIARGISQPEARTNVLIRLAEGQALNGRPAEATAAYAEAARAVATIPLNDPRETLIGVLIDSLISYGRFDDARASIRMYNTPGRQVVAYAAIAESQGRRGLAASAREWIAREISAEYQPLMYRKVNDGLLTAIEQNRSKDLSRTGYNNQ